MVAALGGTWQITIAINCYSVVDLTVGVHACVVAALADQACHVRVLDNTAITPEDSPVALGVGSKIARRAFEHQCDLGWWS